MPLLFVVLLVSLMSACATHNAPLLSTSDESRQLWQDRLNQLDKLDHWAIRGRVVIFIQDDVHNAGLNWLRQMNDTTLTLEGPLSQGSILLQKDADGVKLTSADGEQYSGKNSQQLLSDITGMMIPVEGLQTWIKGVPHADSSQSADIDANGRAMNIQQDGWSINYLEYERISWDQYNNPYLPRKMYLKNNKLALKIVIDQWRNPDQPDTPSLFPDFNTY